MSNMDKFTVRVTAREVRNRNVRLRLVAVIALVAILLLLVAFTLAVYVDKAGNFTVDVIEWGPDTAISICDKPDFSNPSTYLEADAVYEMDNITEAWLPTDIDKVDGSHNGKDYIAYTFYVKNTGIKEISYQADIDILSVMRDADEAVRVKVYRNGTPTLFAKRQTGNSDPEPDTTPFFSETKVMSQSFDNMKSGDMDKYTVIIWLEGNDPECVDDIKGGEVKMIMRLKVLDQDEELA